MYIAKNLQYLRKRDKITQEDLAEKLNVSRQSVSKWETGEAYPETEKLLAICDLFDVSLDGLMRTDLSVVSVTESENEEIPDKICLPEKSAEDESDVEQKITEHRVFAEHIDKFSRGMAIGVLLILLGVAVCVALSGFAATLSEAAAQLTNVMSGVAVILFTAAAVFLFVLNGQRHEAFKKMHPVIAQPDEAIHSGFAVKMAALVSGILVDVVYLVVMTALIDAAIIKTVNEDMAFCYVTAAFLAVLAFIIGGLVYMGIQHTKYNIYEYKKQIGHDMQPIEKNRVEGAICGVVMLTATAIFLIIGFVGNFWHPGWIVFPIGGIFCGIIELIFRAKKDK